MQLTTEMGRFNLGDLSTRFHGGVCLGEMERGIRLRHGGASGGPLRLRDVLLCLRSTLRSPIDDREPHAPKAHVI
jgi:hypothetical protein